MHSSNRRGCGQSMDGHQPELRDPGFEHRINRVVAVEPVEIKSFISFSRHLATGA
jgi:hypothetical protein